MDLLWKERGGEGMIFLLASLLTWWVFPPSLERSVSLVLYPSASRTPGQCEEPQTCPLCPSLACTCNS